jgi:hypothetical protein
MDHDNNEEDDFFEGRDYGQKELDAFYEELSYPPNLILQFSSMDDFADWTREGTIKDIDCMRLEFEKHELYGYLIVIRDILIEKRMEEELEKLGILMPEDDEIKRLGAGTPPGTQLKLEL